MDCVAHAPRQTGWDFLGSTNYVIVTNDEAVPDWQFDKGHRVVSKTTHIDFFISYRREGGATVARLLYEVLALRGLRGFIDAEKLEQGDYNAAIIDSIDKAHNFILIVSPGALDSDWVVKEVAAAITATKNIIPVFINGIREFPKNLPECIADLAKQNAIFLDHSDFDAKFQKLISWLVTPHVKLTSACIDYWKRADDGADAAFAAWKALADPKDVIEVTTTELRKVWQSSRSKSAAQQVLESIGTSDMKAIAKNLGIEHKGNRDTLLDTVYDWLREGRSLMIREDSYQEEERYGRLRSALAKRYKSGNELAKLKEIVDNEDLNPRDRRSSQSLMQAVFDCPRNQTVGDIFDMLELPQETINDLAMELGIVEQLRRNARGAQVRTAINSWIDYADRPSIRNTAPQGI